MREPNVFVINGETVYLSVQAGLERHSTPNKRGLKLKEYSHVEVLIYIIKENRLEIYYPSDFGFKGIDEYFESVGTQVPIEKVQAFADHLQKLSEREEE